MQESHAVAGKPRDAAVLYISIDTECTGTVVFCANSLTEIH